MVYFSRNTHVREFNCAAELNPLFQVRVRHSSERVRRHHQLLLP
jgi:hypothetical protein